MHKESHTFSFFSLFYHILHQEQWLALRQVQKPYFKGKMKVLFFLDFFFFCSSSLMCSKTPSQVVLLINKFSSLTWGFCTSYYKNLFLIIFNKTKAYCWVKKVIASYYQWKWYWRRNQLAQFYKNSSYILFSCNLENNCHTEFFSSKQKCLDLDKLIKGLWIIQINYVSVLEHQ